jgi:hypothetical protein
MSHGPPGRALWAVMLGFVVTQSHASAQDGPAPVDSSASLSAGADEDIQRSGDRANTEHEHDHPAGTYTGVAPGGSVVPPPAVAGKTPATITWPGFQMRADGTSRVFIQSTTALDAQPSAAPGKYLVNLRGAHVSGGTNRLPLETRFFNTPVTRVSLSANHDGAQLILDLRAEVSPQISSERGSSGYYFTYIDLPKGNYVTVTTVEKPKATARAATATASAPPAHRRRVASHPNDLTTYLDGDSSPSPAAGSGNIDSETPPGIKPQHPSGQIKLER